MVEVWEGSNVDGCCFPELWSIQHDSLSMIPMQVLFFSLGGV